MNYRTKKTPPSGIHPGSLVHFSMHSSASLELYEADTTPSLIEYAVDCVVETVHYAFGWPSSSRGRSHSWKSERAAFLEFVTEVVTRAGVQPSVLMVALVYIHRAKPHLEIAIEQWANERTFLGALILANKYLNDSTLKNVHWALASQVFHTRDILRIEREFLDVLDYDLGVSEAEILYHDAALKTYTDPFPYTILHTDTRHISADSGSALHPTPTTWSSDKSTLAHAPSPHHLEFMLSPRPSDHDWHRVLHPTPVGFHTADQSAPSISLKQSEYMRYGAVPARPRKSPAPSHKASRHLNLNFSSAFNALRSIPVPIPYFHNRTSPQSNPHLIMGSDNVGSRTLTSSWMGAKFGGVSITSAVVPGFHPVPRPVGEFARPILLD